MFDSSSVIIPEDRAAEAYRWLLEQGTHPDTIKSVEIWLGRRLNVSHLFYVLPPYGKWLTMERIKPW